MNSRPLRLAFDAFFLLLALLFLIQDWSHHDTPGAILWGAFTLFWIVAIPIDMNRTRTR